MTTQVIKAIKVVRIIATVRSKILCQLTAKMICGLKSLTFADSGLSECHMFKSVGWHKASPVARFWGMEDKINC